MQVMAKLFHMPLLYAIYNFIYRRPQ